MKNLFLRTAFIFSFFFLMGFSLSAQHNHKNCGSDHMTDLIKQQFPAHAQAWEDYHQRVIPALIKNQPAAQRSTAATILRIPVVVHVIHSGEAIGSGSNLSVARIQAQLDVLNEDFSALNANFNQTPSQWTSVIGNPDIQFCLANVDPSGNPSNGVTRHNMTVTGSDINNSNIENEIKPATTWNSNIYYNVWLLPIPGTSAGGGTVGYAYLPNNFTIGSDLDGTVVDWRWFGGPGFGQSGFKTMTHETGHYLGLPHTFNETDCGGDDNIGDTPNISAATANLIPSLNCSSNNFPTGPSSCGNEHMYVNYMDYVNSDYCYTSFTEGQISVMRGVLEGDRPFNYGSRMALINNSNTACASAANNIGITSVIRPTAGTNCTAGPINPQVIVGNFGTEAITTFSVSYRLDNSTPVTENFVDNIASGSSVTVSLATFTPPASTYDFTVYTQNPNGVTDTQTDNDTISVSSVLVDPQALPLIEDFTNTQINPTPAGSYTFNQSADGFVWQHTPISANGSTGGAILFDNYEGDGGGNPFGTIDAFITPVLDLTDSDNTNLTFDVAYARYGDGSQFFNDSLRILVSTDCGSNYNQLIFNDGGATLETGTAASTAFTPSASEWDNKILDLSNYDGQPSVSLAFVNVSGWGNRLFLDNINITQEETVACDITANVSTVEPLCFNDQGTVQVTAQGGNAPYSYGWSNGQTDNTFSAPAGTYSVTVTDSNECTTTVTTEVLQPAAISINIDKTDETTANANDGTATANVSGGTGPEYSFQWSNNATMQSVSNLAPGNYSVTVTDQNDCAEETVFTILAGQVNCDLTATISTQQPLCFGEQGTIQVLPEGGNTPYSYTWSNGQTDDTFSAPTGIYSVTVTDSNECTTTVTTEISQPAAISINIDKTDETTANANDGTATANVSGGTGPEYSFQWSNNTTTQSVSNLAPGNYSVTVTDQNNCSEEIAFEVEAGEVDCSQISLTLAPTATRCSDSDDGSIMATPEGGSGNYQYNWSNGMSSQNMANLSAGNYSLTLTDQAGCSTSATAVVTAPAVLSATLSATKNQTGGTPPNGTATAIPAGGVGDYTYQWSNGGTTATIEDLTAGNYSVTVFDNNECSWTGSIEVATEEIDCSSLSLSFDNGNLSCNGANDGFAEAIASGGSPEYTFQWSNGMSTALITGLSAGNYEVTITDINGCSTVETTEITEATPLSTNLTVTNDECNNNGTTLSVNPSGGTGSYQVNWSNSATDFTNQVTVSDSYQVTVTDAAGCFQSEVIEVSVINNNLALTVSLNEISCTNENDGSAIAMIEGGTAPYTYEWSTGDEGMGINNLSPGNYSVEITDALGCTRNQIFSLSGPAPISLSCSGTPEDSGGDGFVEVSSSGGSAPYQYEWSTGDTGSFVQGLNNGVYDVTVTDQNGCISICSVNLTPTNTATPENIRTLKVFPNPASDQLFIHADLLESEAVKISLVNLMGQTVKVNTTNGISIRSTIQLTDLAAGTYFLRLETTHGTAIRKVVVF